MNCEVYQEHISALVDQELDDAASADVFAHLGTCADCRTFLHDVRRIQRHIAETPLPAVSPSLDTRVRTIPLKNRWQSLLHSVRIGRGWWRRRLQIPLPAFAALLLMLLASLAVALALLRTPQSQPGHTPTLYIMSLSPIEVQAQRIYDTPHAQ